MKRISLLAALLGALVLAFAGIAMAGGNGTQVSHYNATYTDPTYGPVNCTGVHQVMKNQPTQESFTCKSTTGLPLTNLSAGQTITLTAVGWVSDFDQTTHATGGTGTVSADDMSYSAVAIYN